MSWVAVIDEPLAVDPVGHLFQNLDPAVVILDQIVVRGQDGCYLALDSQRRERILLPDGDHFNVDTRQFKRHDVDVAYQRW